MVNCDKHYWNELNKKNSEHLLIGSSEAESHLAVFQITQRSWRDVFLIYKTHFCGVPLMGAERPGHRSYISLCEHVNQPFWVCCAGHPLLCYFHNPVVFGRWNRCFSFVETLEYCCKPGHALLSGLIVNRFSNWFEPECDSLSPTAPYI